MDAYYILHLLTPEAAVVCGASGINRCLYRTDFIIWDLDTLWPRCKDCLNTLTSMEYLNTVEL